MEITNIAFEYINGDYHWGKYGKFKVIINIKTGYINATHLCARATTKNDTKKRFKDWDGKQKIDLIEAVSSLALISAELLVVTNMEGNYITRGTYAHPDLIPHIACWASPTFAAKVSKIINEYFIKEAIQGRDIIIGRQKCNIDRLEIKVDEQNRKIDELMTRNDEQSRKIDELLNRTNQTLEDLNQMQCSLDITTEELEKTSVAAENADEQTKLICKKLDIAVERRVPRDPISCQNEILGIYNKPNSLEYRVIRCQYRARKASEARCITQGYTRQVYYKEDPNAVNIFNRIKQQLPPHIGNVSREYFITLLKDKEAEFLQFVVSVEQEKKVI